LYLGARCEDFFSLLIAAHYPLDKKASGRACSGLCDHSRTAHASRGGASRRCFPIFGKITSLPADSFTFQPFVHGAPGVPVLFNINHSGISSESYHDTWASFCLRPATLPSSGDTPVDSHDFKMILLRLRLAIQVQPGHFRDCFAIFAKV